MESVLMDADKDNPASWRTMESLGGKNIREFFDNENSNCIVKDYEINVNESINNNSAIYEPMIKKTMSRK